MRFLAICLVIVAAFVALLASRHSSRQAPAVATAAPSAPATRAGPATPGAATPTALPRLATPAPAASTPTAVADDGKEPDEASLRRLVLAEYEQIERMGGMTLTLSVNGKSMVVHPKVKSVRKDGCRQLAQQPGHWECGVELTMTLHDGDEPTPKAERMYVRRGPAGDWVAG